MQAADGGFELFECLNEEELAAVGSLVETLGTYAPGQQEAGRRRTADRNKTGVEYETVQEQNAWTMQRDWHSNRWPPTRRACSARNPWVNTSWTAG